MHDGNKIARINCAFLDVERIDLDQRGVLVILFGYSAVFGLKRKHFGRGYIGHASKQHFVAVGDQIIKRIIIKQLRRY
ncbi:hypothetical protein SDC9_173341 [bioreactor metagenome]|uniref:Uncharacterized protein n=1 Tax=bioreactor metagenome TaxID=1076179 RepID=A0A645GIG7_9ZZZZ